MAVVVACEGCGKQLRAPETMMGKRVRCPGCGGPVLVQARAYETPPEHDEPAPRTIPAQCSCGHRFQAGETYRGKLVRCPGCNQPVRVPDGGGHEMDADMEGPPAFPPLPVASYAAAPAHPSMPVAAFDGSYESPAPPVSRQPPRRRGKPPDTSSKTLWIVVGIVGGSLAVIALILGIVIAASRPSINVEGKVFVGHETLMGFGELKFEFYGNHKVVMIDAGQNAPGGVGIGRRPFPVQLGGPRRVDGDWHQNGTKVTCNFKDCRYEGTLENDILTGTARFTDGPQRNQNWTFTISFKGQRVK